MKTLTVLLTCLIVTLSNDFKNKEEKADVNRLLGEWRLDMSPQDKTDSNFAMMKITKINNMTFQGEFYRNGVEIRNGQINIQLGVIYGALISGDNSGEYNTTFYLEDGILHGSTHSVQRGFLSVWTATKVK